MVDKEPRVTIVEQLTRLQKDITEIQAQLDAVKKAIDDAIRRSGWSLSEPDEK